MCRKRGQDPAKLLPGARLQLVGDDPHGQAATAKRSQLLLVPPLGTSSHAPFWLMPAEIFLRTQPVPEMCTRSVFSVHLVSLCPELSSSGMSPAMKALAAKVAVGANDAGVRHSLLLQFKTTACCLRCETALIQPEFMCQLVAVQDPAQTCSLKHAGQG